MRKVRKESRGKDGTAISLLVAEVRLKATNWKRVKFSLLAVPIDSCSSGNIEYWRR